MITTGNGTGLLNQLIDLVEYRVILGAVATTLDGLVVAQASLLPDDAELLAAAAASVDDATRQIPAQGGRIDIRHGRELRLVVLSETDAPLDEIDRLMETHLAALEETLVA